MASNDTKLVDYPRHKVVVLASRGARLGQDSPLLRFVRDHAAFLRTVEVHATGGTARCILSTGLFLERRDIVSHSDGPAGGVVEVAAIVARREAEAVVFLSDPLDERSDVPENFALQRMCRAIGTPLANTLATAEEWVLSRQLGSKKEPPAIRCVYPEQWEAGIKNMSELGVVLPLEVDKQTVALIAHDKKKHDMVEFVAELATQLRYFHRILTTGTTGWLLKLLCVPDEKSVEVFQSARRALGEQRYETLLYLYWSMRLDGLARHRWSELSSSIDETIGIPGRRAMEDEVDRLLKSRNRALQLPATDQQLASIIMPLPSGPDGGDILIASEMLQHACHRVYFFQDPGSPHAHEADIRLLERTSQARGVHCVCLSDKKSAGQSMAVVSATRRADERVTSRDLCNMFPPLKDVVIVDPGEVGNTSSESLGNLLSRAAAGYLCRWVEGLQARGGLRSISVSHGWTIRRVASECKDLVERFGLRRGKEPVRLEWLPANSRFQQVPTEEDAASVCDAFVSVFGGETAQYRGGGLTTADAFDAIHVKDRDLIARARQADIIVASATQWTRETAKRSGTLVHPDYLPPFEPEKVAGTVGAVFIDRNGHPVANKYLVIGLRLEDYQQAARRGRLLCIGGGEERHNTVLAALRGQLMSVLVTTRATATWLLESARLEGRDASGRREETEGTLAR